MVLRGLIKCGFLFIIGLRRLCFPLIGLVCITYLTGWDIKNVTNKPQFGILKLFQEISPCSVHFGLVWFIHVFFLLDVSSTFIFVYWTALMISWCVKNSVATFSWGYRAFLIGYYLKFSSRLCVPGSWIFQVPPFPVPQAPALTATGNWDALRLKAT